ncbi:MAG TPA: hypothetical protein VHU84_16085 [Lacipirellulaceae bacterium]|nr:hypothetical protein [Lacipirellulaceae bacterium]
MITVSANQQFTANSLPTCHQRLGLTTLEFMGCLIAVVGGAWLGALYLGVDVKTAAYTALSQSQLLNKMPKEWRPDAPQDKVVTREQLVTALHEELGTLRNQITALQTGKNESVAGVTTQSTSDSTSQLPTKDRTLAYWTRLNEIALGEADLQKDAESAFNASNAAKVFAIKGRISRFAAKAVEAVPTQEIDEAALKFGRQLQLWYEGGGELYERAVRIWETPMGQQARAKLNDEWKQADLQHHNEAKLVNDKAIAVRSTIGRIYGVDFPEFAKPAPAAEGQETSAKST